MIVDVADEIISGRRPDIPAFVGRARSMSTTLVIDGVDLLDAQSVALLGLGMGAAGLYALRRRKVS